MVATMMINNELNGIEIKFDCKPMACTLEVLKKAGFRWHNLKKIWYAKQTAERLEIAKTVTGLEEYAEQVRKEEPAEEKKAEKKAAEKVNKYGVKVGDVFFDSWGYEQTNIDFYQVVGLRGTTQIILAAIGKEGRAIGFCSEMVKPKKDAFLTGTYKTRQQDGDTLIKTVRKYGDSIMAGSGRDALMLTTWDAEHNETSYY